MTLNPKPLRLPSKDSYFKAVGTEGHTNYVRLLGYSDAKGSCFLGRSSLSLRGGDEGCSNQDVLFPKRGSGDLVSRYFMDL